MSGDERKSGDKDLSPSGFGLLSARTSSPAGVSTRLAKKRNPRMESLRRDDPAIHVPGAPGPNPSRIPPEVPPRRSFHDFIAGVVKASQTWPRRRRILALQSLLLDASEIVNYAVNELQAMRTGQRFPSQERT